MKNRFYKHYRLLLPELKNSEQFGLSSIYSWPFRQDHAQYLVQNALTLEGTSNDEVVKCVQDLLESDDNFGSYQLASDEFYSRSIYIVDQIVYIYNCNNLIINSWSVGLIIKSAVLYLIKSDLDRCKIAYDRREARNHEAFYLDYDVSLVVFFFAYWLEKSLRIVSESLYRSCIGVGFKRIFFDKGYRY
jgi:hypothetical protein